MPVNMTVTLDQQQLRSLQRKLKGPPRIYEPAVKSGLKTMATEAAAVLKARAPRLTGRLQKSLRPTIRSAGFVSGVNFNPIGSGGGRTSRRDSGGFRSGWALDTSHRYHPRGGGMTLGWISEAVPVLVGGVRRHISAMAVLVEEAWGRK